jgi:hypothetical protein
VGSETAAVLLDESERDRLKHFEVVAEACS